MPQSRSRSAQASSGWSLLGDLPGGGGPGHDGTPSRRNLFLGRDCPKNSLVPHQTVSLWQTHVCKSDAERLLCWRVQHPRTVPGLFSGNHLPCVCAATKRARHNHWTAFWCETSGLDHTDIQLQIAGWKSCGCRRTHVLCRHAHTKKLRQPAGSITQHDIYERQQAIKHGLGALVRPPLRSAKGHASTTEGKDNSVAKTTEPHFECGETMNTCEMILPAVLFPQSPHWASVEDWCRSLTSMLQLVVRLCSRVGSARG